MTTKTTAQSVEESDTVEAPRGGRSAVEWHVINAAEVPLGRMATEIATLLQGKHRTDYAPNVVAPVNVVVVNSDELRVTGNKMAQKTYYRYSGYPGGMRERTLDDQMQRDSRVVIRRAVSGMLPKNNLRDDLMTQLKVYTGAEHPHTQAGAKKDKK